MTMRQTMERRISLSCSSYLAPHRHASLGAGDRASADHAWLCSSQSQLGLLGNGSRLGCAVQVVVAGAAADSA